MCVCVLMVRVLCAALSLSFTLPFPTVKCHARGAGGDGVVGVALKIFIFKITFLSMDIYGIFMCSYIFIVLDIDCHTVQCHFIMLLA